MAGSAFSFGVPSLGSGLQTRHASSAAHSTPQLLCFPTQHSLTVTSWPYAVDSLAVRARVLRSPPRCNYDALRQCGNECPVAGCAASNRFKLLRRDGRTWQRLKPSAFFLLPLALPLSWPLRLHAVMESDCMPTRSSLDADSRSQATAQSAAGVDGDCVAVQW